MTIYDFERTTLNGEEVNFSDFKGKPILIVNTASKCGYTPQYADLQLLHESFGEQITVLGFPSNNFGGQEPGTNEEVATFCDKVYGVSFPMFKKIDVIGKDQDPLFQFLQNKTGKAPTWNFCKYLVSADGSEIKFFGAAVNPGEIAENL